MSRSRKSEDRLIQYLLGLMPEEEKLKLEDEYLHDDALNQEIQAVERELMDGYLEGSLSDVERNRFETFFLCSQTRRDRLRFAKSLRAYGSKVQSEAEQSTGPVRVKPAAFLRSRGNRYVGLAAFAVLIIAIGLLVWRVFIFRSVDQQAMIALANGYKSGRLFEARISALPYASVAQSRGDASQNLEIKKAELLAITEETDHQSARSLHTLGRVYLAEQRFGEAVERLRSAAEADPNDALIQSDLGAALMEHARQESPEIRGQEMSESLDHLNKAVKLDEFLLEARFNRALYYEYMHLWEDARTEWQAYLQRDSTSGWAEEARRHLAEIDEKKTGSNQKVEKDFGDFVAALSRGDDSAAWDAFRINRDRVDNRIVKRLLDEYLAASEQGKTTIAAEKLDLISRAGRLEFEKCRDRFSLDLERFYSRTSPRQRELATQARASLRSAFQSYAGAEYERASELYEQAEQGFTKAGDEGEALGARFWTAACLLRLTDVSRALSIIEPLIALSSRRDYKTLLAHSLLSMSDADTARREFSNAIDNATRAGEIFESTGDINGRLRSLQTPAAVSYQLGAYYKSIGCAIRALDLAETFFPEPRDVWPLYQLIASSYSDLNLPSMALPFQGVSNELAIQSGTPLLRSRSYAIQAVIFQKLHRYEEAIASGQRALTEAGSIGGKRTRNNIIANSTLMLAHVSYEAGAFDRAVEYYDQAIELHRGLKLDLYLAEAHKGKLQAMIGIKDDSAVQHEIETAIAVLEQDRSKILEEEDRNSYFELAQGTYNLAIDFAYRHLADKQAAFEYSELSHARSLLDLMAGGGEVVTGRNEPGLRAGKLARPLSLREIQERLPENTEILQYAVLDEGESVIAWVVSRDSSIQSAYQKTSGHEFADQVHAFVQEISAADRTDQDKTTKQAMALYRLLIEPVRSFLNPNATVFIVPDRLLNSLPFGALVCPESGRYFVEDFAYALSPSSSVMLACSERAAEKTEVRDEKLLAIGNPAFDKTRFGSLPDLPAAEKEVRSISSLYGSNVTLIGADARPRSVKARMSDAEVIHFAGHYVVNMHSPLLSILLLSRDDSEPTGDSSGVLLAEDVYRMPLTRLRLVVLSACGTAMDRSYGGEGAIGMARPFIKSGALALATLWPVDSQPTSELMIDFHKRRKLDRMDDIRALRQAQLDALNQTVPEIRSPHNWAAFVAIGGYTHF